MKTARIVPTPGFFDENDGIAKIRPEASAAAARTHVGRSTANLQLSNEFCFTGSKRREDGRVRQIEHGIESDPLTCESTSGFDLADTTGPPGGLRKPANLLSAR